MRDQSPTDDRHAPTTRFLLDRHHAGDPQALGELLARELPAIRERVHRGLGGALRHRMDTNDMVQEICLLVLRRGPRFVVRDDSCFRALMARLVHNALVSSFRRYRSSLEFEQTPHGTTCLDFDAPSPTNSPATKVEAEEERELVRVALLLLDPLDAEVLHLRDQSDLSFVEIGRRLDASDDAMRMRHRRALRKLEHIVVQLKNGRLTEALAELERETQTERDDRQ